MPDDDLVILLRAIALGDHGLVATIAHRTPTLVTAAVGADSTRDRSSEFWLADAQHQVYAGDTPLHIAAASHQPAIVRMLLRLGAQVSATNRRRARPLHYAADGHPGGGDWRPVDQATVISVLITAGADPNAYDLNGSSPLHRAVRNRCAAAVAALLEGGADPARPNGHGSTPQQLATHPTGRGGSGSRAARAQQAEILGLLTQAAQG